MFVNQYAIQNLMCIGWLCGGRGCVKKRMCFCRVLGRVGGWVNSNGKKMVRISRALQNSLRSREKVHVAKVIKCYVILKT